MLTNNLQINFKKKYHDEKSAQKFCLTRLLKADGTEKFTLFMTCLEAIDEENISHLISNCREEFFGGKFEKRSQRKFSWKQNSARSFLSRILNHQK